MAWCVPVCALAPVRARAFARKWFHPCRCNHFDHGIHSRYRCGQFPIHGEAWLCEKCVSENPECGFDLCEGCHRSSACGTMVGRVANHLTAVTSAPELGSPLPHPRRGWARQICTGTGLAPATSARGPGSPVPHLRRDWSHHCHIGTGTGLTTATSAPGLGSPLPHLRRDWAHPCHICAGTGLTTATSAPGLVSPLPPSAPGPGLPVPQVLSDA
jgi:hypothetical protein